MRMRPTHGVAVVFAAALAATVGSSGPAEAFFFLPMFQQSQQPSFEVQIRQEPERQHALEARPGDGRRRRAGQAFRRDAREARRREVELRLVGQERKVAGEIQVQLLAGTAHPQRSSGAASEQEQRPRQRLGAPGKPRERRQYAASRATGPAQQLQRERRRAGAQLPPAPAAPSAIPSTRSSARCSRRGSTRSSSSRISRAQPKQQLTARATRKRGPELARIRSASMFA